MRVLFPDFVRVLPHNDRLMKTRRAARSDRRLALNAGVPLFQVGSDLLDVVARALLGAQEPQHLLAASLACRDLSESARPLLHQLEVSSRLTPTSFVLRHCFRCARHALQLDGTVWVTNMNKHVVDGFSARTGQHVRQLEDFRYPWFLARAGAELFVAETSGERIRVFDAGGVKLREWQMEPIDPTDPPPVWMQGIAVIGKELFVARPQEKVVSVHDTATGEYLRSWKAGFTAHFGIQLAVVGGLIFIMTEGSNYGPDDTGPPRIEAWTPAGERVNSDFCAASLSARPLGMCAVGELLCVACVTDSNAPSVPHWKTGHSLDLVLYTMGGTLLRRITAGPWGALSPALLSADEATLYLAGGPSDRVVAFAIGESRPTPGAGARLRRGRGEAGPSSVCA